MKEKRSLVKKKKGPVNGSKDEKKQKAGLLHLHGCKKND